MAAFESHLQPTAGALEAIETAVGAGWYVWIVTQSSQQLVLQYLQDHCCSPRVLIMSCDELKVAKPHAKVYAQVMRRTIQLSQKIESFYMISAHPWDLEGSKNVSMKTVHVTNVPESYGEQVYGRRPDLVGINPLDCVEKVMEYEHRIQVQYAALL
ncbi:hypothetical protein DM01DRAFT_1339210 [Hesseltinella vesiculosa]|uniref:HAD-like protein n=1 Tax=Hesseltinella vesiculosa TaxID=101127 RepID=A0A1X2G8V6_9FUNG|nr:hypothetical protein DM01DRAFT_1339210 [Hesseltinella vesiculosa]